MYIFASDAKPNEKPSNGHRTRFAAYTHTKKIILKWIFWNCAAIASPAAGRRVYPVRRNDPGLQNRGKMFCYTDMVEFRWIAVKCDPDRAVLLRERYPELVTPAFHSNKRHWNGIRTDGDLPDAFIREQLRHSYLLVAAGITPKALRQEIRNQIEKAGLPEE